MALTSMKRDQGENELAYEGMPRFGYGLQISLDEEQCEKLGLDRAPKAGQQFTLRAVAVAVSVTESVERDGDSDGPDVCVCLQITDLEVKPDGAMSAKTAAKLLYGD